jgi:predicted transcriptional regulator
MTTTKDLNIFYSLYILLLSYDATKPTRRKYKISFNLLYTLIGCHCYTTLVKDKFSFTSIHTIVRIYDNKRLHKYFTILEDLGLVYQSSNKGTIKYYSLSDKGINMINEIIREYNRCLYEFSNKYNVVL